MSVIIVAMLLIVSVVFAVIIIIQTNSTNINDHIMLYGAEYDEDVLDEREFKFSEVVFCCGERYFIVSIDSYMGGTIYLHLSKTLSYDGYKENGFIADSREVKKIIRSFTSASI